MKLDSTTYQLFYENSLNGGCVLPNHRISFEFNSIDILIEFEADAKGEKIYTTYESYVFLDGEESLKKDIQELNITAIYIAKYGIECNIYDAIEYEMAYSTSLLMFDSIKILKSKYENIIQNFGLEQVNGYGDSGAALFCGADFLYIFLIKIDKAYFLNEKLWRYVCMYLNPKKQLILAHYLDRYNIKVRDDKPIDTVTTNTKVRRLGYFKILSDFFSQQKKQGRGIVFKKFENYANQYTNALDSHKNSKGLIKLTRTGNSARPYLEVATELGFLNVINNYYSLGKSMKVYSQLKAEYHQKAADSENIFQLSELDKLFFLGELLKRDFLYLTAILELIYLYPNISAKNLGSKFKGYILSYLKNVEETFWGSEKKKRNLRKITQRINSWEKPIVYSEHILMPRLNWLYDLDIIELSEKGNMVQLTTQGERLFRHVCNWYDVAERRISTCDEFLSKFYLYLFNDVYDGEYVETPKTAQLIELYLDAAFEHFKTLAPNRVTSSQAFTYIQYKLYLFDFQYLEIEQIENYIKKHNEKYNYVFHKQYNDGYIQKVI